MADCLTMRGRSFADVLDAALHAGVEPAAVRRASWGFTAPPLGPLRFAFAAVPPPRPHARAAYELAAATAGSFPRSRPALTLTTPQQQALDGLNALGGRLPAEFTASDLRAAYRRLAHRLHPDRHRASSAIEAAHLAREFAEATGHYRVLLTLFPRH